MIRNKSRLNYISTLALAFILADAVLKSQQPQQKTGSKVVAVTNSSPHGNNNLIICSDLQLHWIKENDKMFLLKSTPLPWVQCRFHTESRKLPRNCHNDLHPNLSPSWLSFETLIEEIWETMSSCHFTILQSVHSWWLDFTLSYTVHNVEVRGVCF